MLRQFPAALKLYDRALDIRPNDSDLMASIACMYQAQGNLDQAAKFVSEITMQTPSENAVRTKVNQLTLERNYDEAVRLLQARQAQFHFESEIDKGLDQVLLSLAQRLAGDTAESKAAAEKARATVTVLCKDQPENSFFAALLSLAIARIAEKDSAINEAERAMKLLPTSKDNLYGPGFEENLALVQTIFGESSRAISTLTRLLQTPYVSPLYGPTPITPALLRLDPLWDPLRADPAFQKLCEEKHP
jgi:serine/threonine-protein kinase